MTSTAPCQTSRSRFVLAMEALSRWLLVLVLLFDQVGAPLHRHIHDSGIDAQWLLVASHGIGLGKAHVEDGETQRHLTHAVLALREQTENRSSAWDADHDTPIAAECAHDPQVVATAHAPAHTEFHRPLGFRCLPPAGRAPPVRA
jgi:hypothetical protein